MKWFYVVSHTENASRDDDMIVHSKHRTRPSAEQRIRVKLRQFNTAGVPRRCFVIEEEGWHLSAPSIIRAGTIVL